MKNFDYFNLSRIINSTFFIFLFIGTFIACTVIIFINVNGLKLFNISPDNYDTAKHILYIAAIISILSWPLGVLQHSIEGLQKYHTINKILISTRILGIICIIITSSNMLMILNFNK